MDSTIYNVVDKITRHSKLKMTVMGNESTYIFKMHNGEWDLLRLDDFDNPEAWYGISCDTIADYKTCLKNEISANVITKMEIIYDRC